MDLCVSTSALCENKRVEQRTRHRFCHFANGSSARLNPACLTASLPAWARFMWRVCVPASPSQGTATKQRLFPCWALVSLGDRTLYGGINSDSDSIGNVRDAIPNGQLLNFAQEHCLQSYKIQSFSPNKPFIILKHAQFRFSIVACNFDNCEVQRSRDL